MRTAAQWLDDYGDSHRNQTNKALHWICVPVIAWCVLGLLWSLPFPASLRALHPVANWAGAAALAALLYYAFLSLRLALGALVLFATMLWSIDLVDHLSPLPLWSVCLYLFVIAWIGQFIGHAIEGKRPSFFKDVQFLMIGPLWLLADVYRRLGVRF
ncbi:MAG: Mpo1-like protein [Gammaproteobacteria bacterium]